MSAPVPAIAWEGVHKRFGAQHVLRGVQLCVTPGTATYVIGASGAGKSVLGRLAVGLLQPDEGRVLVEGRAIEGLRGASLDEARARCAMVLQGGTLLDWLSLEENVALPLASARRIPRRDALRLARAYLEAVGLQELAGKQPAAVGPGVRKRCSIARALALEPSIVIFDEPTTGLDPRAARTVDRLIRRVAGEGRTAVVVSHDLPSIFGVADRIALLHEGTIRFQGTPAELRASEDPVVQRFLGGDDEGAPAEAARRLDQATREEQDEA